MQDLWNFQNIEYFHIQYEKKIAEMIFSCEYEKLRCCCIFILYATYCEWKGRPYKPMNEEVQA